MNKDGGFNYLHLHRARDVDLFEDLCRDRLPADDIYVPAHHQPINPEDEDDVVPDQHAAFGITRALAAASQRGAPGRGGLGTGSAAGSAGREPAWRDLGLAELMARGPARRPAPEGGLAAAADLVGLASTGDLLVDEDVIGGHLLPVPARAAPPDRDAGDDAAALPVPGPAASGPVHAADFPVPGGPQGSALGAGGSGGHAAAAAASRRARATVAETGAASRRLGMPR